MKRVRYDDVEAMAMQAARKGHDIELGFRYTGMLHVFHNGKEVLVDGPRDYSVALTKVQSLMWHEQPVNPPGQLIEEKDVRRPARAKKPKAKKEAAGGKRK